MEVGHCLLCNPTGILLRFRWWQIVITSEIEKAFLQICVKKDDCDVHRFLRGVDGTTKMIRFTRVPFGHCSSPFLLNATVQFHLSGFPESRVVEELKENMYVDAFLSGADSVKECCTMVKDAIGIMSQASMPLVKWGFNSPKVAEILLRDFRDKYLDRDSFKVWGLLWLASDDCFTFKGSVLDLCKSKRVVLSFFSKLFDPLGFAAPYVLQAKPMSGIVDLAEMMRSLLNTRFVSCAGWMGLMCWNHGGSQGGTLLVNGMPFATCSFMHFLMRLPRLMELVCICELSSVITRLCHLWSWLSLRWHL